MGTHPIFESDFDCLTEGNVNMAVSMNDSGSRSSSPENSKEEGELRNGADSSDSDSRDTDTRKSRSRTREKSTSESTSHSRDRKEKKVEKDARKNPSQKETSLHK